jgi:uncharacterized protein YdhG (YjbR/CyaY superfamily)
LKRATASKTKGKLRIGMSVNAYLASLPREVRAGLQKLRKAIRASLPRAEEGISYGIPAFKLDGRPVVWFAASKRHSSLFPGAAAVRALTAELNQYAKSKGTIRFPHHRPPSAALVAKLVRVRIAEMKRGKR